MADINVRFGRHLLLLITPEVRKAGYSVRDDAGVAGNPREGYFFEGPRGFSWQGRADNAYEARYNGWSAFLTKFHGRV